MDKRFNGLPPLMKDAIETLKELHSIPDALAMPAVLGVANLAVMPHYKIDTIVFGSIPLSLYILCMLPTGKRKSTTYNEISVGIKRFEDRQWDRLKNEDARFAVDEKIYKKKMKEYEKDQEENGQMGTVAIPVPVKPKETCTYRLNKSTLNGIIDQLKSQPFVGLSSSEAGEFFNSHSFQGGKDAMSKSTEMSAALTTMWDGGLITRQTGMDSTRLSNRAVNMLFFLQEETVREFLNNPMFSAQGFVHRILISQSEKTPNSAMDLSDKGIAQIEKLRAKLEPFHARIDAIISQYLQIMPDKDYDLDRRILRLTPVARTLAEHYYNINKDAGNDRLKNWDGFAQRLFEHMLRIAGTLAAFEQKTLVDDVDVAAAMDLMDYFVEQRLNLELGVTSRNQSQVLAVRRLGDWVQEKQFTGTANELRRKVRWFNELSAGEREQILEDAVKSELVFMQLTKSKSNRDMILFSWQEVSQ